MVEKAMAPHSSTLAWKIPRMEEPGGLQSMGSLRVGHDWGTSLSLSCFGEGNGNPLQCSCLENPRDGGAWWAAVYGVAQSRTQLKWLSRSSSSSSLLYGPSLTSYVSPLIKALTPSWGSHLRDFLWPQLPPKVPTSKEPHWRLGAQYMNFEGTQTSSS